MVTCPTFARMYRLYFALVDGRVTAKVDMSEKYSCLMKVPFWKR